MLSRASGWCDTLKIVLRALVSAAVTKTKDTLANSPGSQVELSRMLGLTLKFYREDSQILYPFWRRARQSKMLTPQGTTKAAEWSNDSYFELILIVFLADI